MRCGVGWRGLVCCDVVVVVMVLCDGSDNGEVWWLWSWRCVLVVVMAVCVGCGHGGV